MNANSCQVSQQFPDRRGSGLALGLGARDEGFVMSDSGSCAVGSMVLSTGVPVDPWCLEMGSLVGLLLQRP